MNGDTAIVNIKGAHNHPVNIKRNKPITQMARGQNQMIRISKVEALTEPMPDQYQEFIVEDDDESIVM